MTQESKNLSDFTDEELKEKYSKLKELKEVSLKVKNMDTDSLVKGDLDLSILKDFNASLAANGQLYYNDQMSFFSEIKRDLYAQRKGFKKKMLEAQRNKVAESDPKLKAQYNDLESKYNNMQMGLKIL